MLRPSTPMREACRALDSLCGLLIFSLKYINGKGKYVFPSLIYVFLSKKYVFPRLIYVFQREKYVSLPSIHLNRRGI